MVCVCGLCLFTKIQLKNMLLAVEGDFIKNRDTRKCLKNYAKKRIEELTNAQVLPYKEEYLDILEDLKVYKNLIKEILNYGICENLLETFERLKNSNGRLHQDLDDNFFRQLKMVSPAIVIKNDDNWYRKERLITQCLHNATQKYCTNVFIHPVTVEYRELMKSKLDKTACDLMINKSCLIEK